MPSRIVYGTDEFHFGDLRLPQSSPPHPVAMMVHGGFWRSKYGLAYLDLMCEALTVAGIATWNVEYRRLGNEGGGWPGTYLDLSRATDYLRELAPRYHLDLKHAIAVGHSSGGQLALWLAARGKLPKSSMLYTDSPLPL